MSDANVADAGLEDALVLLQQASVWHADGNEQKAEEAYRRVLALDPGNADALNLLALIRHNRGDNETAVRMLRRAIKINPSARYYNNLGVILSGSRDYVGSVAAYRQAIRIEPGHMPCWSNFLFALDHHPYATPQLRLADRRAFNDRHCAPLTKDAAPHPNDRDPERRLRVGYVSADFKQHSASYAFAPPLLNHSDQIEMVCYNANEGPGDTTTDLFRAKAHLWRDVASLTDAEIADQIRADGIDILVDLSGYSGGNRLMVFARKPAPVQITAFGHATGTALDCMDYLFSDPVAIPEHERSVYYRETILDLPCVMAYDPRGEHPPIMPPPAVVNGHVTFGYLGRAIKLNERLLASWADILHHVPNSRLILKAPEYADEGLREWVMASFIALRVASSRIEIRGATARETHLETYNEIDIALDPFPHGGGVTSADACLMGVPSVTLLGDYVSGRITASILQLLGLGGLVAGTEAEYRTIALGLAEEVSSGEFGLDDRRGLRERLLTSTMCDGPRYAAIVEMRYREAWAKWCGERAT